MERLYYQLVKYGHPTLDPIVVKSDGIISLKKEKQSYNILANIFHDHAYVIYLVVLLVYSNSKGLLVTSFHTSLLNFDDFHIELIFFY